MLAGGRTGQGCELIAKAKEMKKCLVGIPRHRAAYARRGGILDGHALFWPLWAGCLLAGDIRGLPLLP